MSSPSTSRIALAAGLLTLAALNLACSRDAAPPRPLTAPRDAEAAELAVVAPLVKGGTLLNYTVEDIKRVPGQGLLVVLVKAGAFLPDGGESDGGPGCDPSHPDEARAGLAVSLVSKEGSPGAVIKGPYAIWTRPVNVPQAEADRLAAALAALIDADRPVPASLSH
ncbi:MAG: hypothetical protein Q8L48_08010 [Archangium sp.]|nr:hypothetical protein [Archangium sp.]